MPSVLIRRADAAATVRNILGRSTLFRSGITADLLGQAAFILVALALCRLLKGVDQTLAALMVILLVVQIPLAFAAEVHRLDVLDILEGAGPAAVFGAAPRGTLAMNTRRPADAGENQRSACSSPAAQFRTTVRTVASFSETGSSIRKRPSGATSQSDACVPG